MTDTRILVRAARADDAEAVSALLAATYPVLFSGAYSAEVLALALPATARDARLRLQSVLWQGVDRRS